jgi:hypothetical protein
MKTLIESQYSLELTGKEAHQLKDVLQHAIYRLEDKIGELHKSEKVDGRVFDSYQKSLKFAKDFQISLTSPQEIL